jgi:NADH dehydrogenase (ubiquinone) 1 alpha subcomplex subunit 8
VQAVYDSCVKDNIGLDRPHWGYHCLPKIHHTDRPKPIEEKPAWMDNPKVSVI